MKYWIGILITVLFIGMLACSNSGGDSPMMSRQEVEYSDLYIYIGSKEGAIPFDYLDPEIENTDSLIQSLVLVKYFPSFRTALRDANTISFEFLENNLISFIDRNTGMQIISTYLLENNILSVLKDGEEPVYVAHFDSETNTYYRYKYVRSARFEKEKREEQTLVPQMGDGLTNLDEVLKYAGFDSKEDMTVKEDSIVWCNVKYIYR